MFSQLRRDMIVRSRRLQQDVARAHAEQRRVRDEYHLARAERPRGAELLTDLVARYHGISLYPTLLERAGRMHPLAGVRASVVERPATPGQARTVDLVVAGDGWAWSVPAAAQTARRARAFAELINTAAARAARSARPATATGQFRVLTELRGNGVLTDDQFSTAVRRLAHTA